MTAPQETPTPTWRYVLTRALCAPRLVYFAHVEMAGESLDQQLFALLFHRTHGTTPAVAHRPHQSLWHPRVALDRLGIHDVSISRVASYGDAFALSGRRIAVDPSSSRREKLLFRAIAFVLLHDSQSAERPRLVQGAQVESVALLCCGALELPIARDIPQCVWRYLGSDACTEEAAQRILQVAGDILSAGCSLPAS